MKRLAVLSLVAGLLLCGCATEQADPTTQTAAPTVTIAPVTVPTEPEGDALRLESFTVVTVEGGKEQTLVTKLRYEDDALRGTVKTRNGVKIQETVYQTGTDRILSQTQWDDSGDLVSQLDCHYDQQGLLIQRVIQRRDSQTVTDYTYDQGLLTQELCTRDGVEQTRDTYAYDQVGRVTDQAHFEAGVEQERTVCRYSEDGDLLLEIQYELGQETERVEYTYLEPGLTEHYSFYQDGQEIFRCHYEYDGMGRMIRALYFEDDREHCLTTYSYDESGEQIGEVCRYQDGTGYDRTVQTTQEEDRTIRQETLTQNQQTVYVKTQVYDGDGALLELVEEGLTTRTRTTYAYDEAGRLTLQTAYEGDVETTKEVWTFDDSGALVGYRTYTGGVLVWEYHYEYEAGFLVAGSKRSGDGTKSVTLEAVTRLVDTDDPEALAQILGQLEQYL